MEIEPKISTVHDAMVEAVHEDEDRDTYVTATIKLPGDVKDQAQELCRRHGTTLSGYLRHCTMLLVRDYKSE